MADSKALETAIKNGAATIGHELEAYITNSNRSSHKLCDYALENVLLHQAAAQHLHDSANKLVSTGQQLLAISRQMTPQLQQLTAMAATARQLKGNAESLKTLGAALQLKPSGQVEEPGAGQQQTQSGIQNVAKGPS